MRIGPDARLGIGDSDLFQQGDGAGAGGVLAHFLMRADRFYQLRLDGHQRVEAGLRILKDHGNPLAAQEVRFDRAKCAQVRFAQGQRSGCNLPGGWQKAHDRGTDGGFACT